MELHCTLVTPTLRGAHGAPGGGIRHELVLELPEGTPGTEVAAELLRTHGASGLSVEGVPLEELSAGRAPLRSGAVLVEGAPAEPRAAAPLSLVVQAGPAAGTVVPLPRGVLRLGRGGAPGSGPQAVLADPELSREHAAIEVGDSGVMLRDAGSMNGTWVDGHRVRGSVRIAAGQLIRMGATTCTVAFTAEAPHLDTGAGAAAPEPLRVLRSSPPQRRAAMITMAVLPVLLGVGMAVATGMWMFLAFTAVSAVSLLIPLAEGRSARREFERRLAAAAHDDDARRRRAAPDAGVLATTDGAAPASGPAGAPGVDSDGPVHVRLGAADQPANLTAEPADAGVDPPTLEGAPLTVPVRGRFAVHGGDVPVEALLRWILLQLAVLPAAAGTVALVAGGTPATRLAARFLPHVRILSDAEAADPAALDAAGPASGGAAVVLLPGTPPAAADACAAAAAAHGWALIGPERLVGPSAESEIRLGTGRACLVADGASKEFVPDLVPAPAFEAAARRQGARAGVRRAGRVPEQCGLDELAGLRADALTRAWAAHVSPDELRVPLGLSAAGPVVLDLVADGPHLLVAGTTGSGKSELLRSLVAGAAALASPERVTFLFVDFKGGSGLEPLAGLPHCVGLVTDLATGGMDRTLASLRAELKRRERLLAASRAADIADYVRRGGTGLPRLVLVVDEFRMLVEEAPAALGELLRVATVGRSLGMHLVMATQRPQGAISADIRANVTTCLALRLQSEAESSDVIGSPAAGRIPVRLPGRGYLSVGGAEPLEFQAASLGLGGARASDRSVRVHAAEAWLEGRRGEADIQAERSPSEAARPLAEAARAAWERLGAGTVRRPVAPPLPERIGLRLDGLRLDGVGPTGGPQLTGRLLGVGAQDGAVLLGAVDLPHVQLTAPLTWSPGEQGHLALVGPPLAGTSAALAAVAGQLASSATARHLYLLDADGALASLRGHARVGAHVGLGEVRRAARVIVRLAEECSARLDGDGGTPLVLAVSGWGSWISAFRQSPYGWAEETFNDLVRDGPAAGLVLVASGERELVASRAFTGMPSRLYFPHGATDEARLSWPRLPAMPSVAGRAAAVGIVVGADSLAGGALAGRGALDGAFGGAGALGGTGEGLTPASPSAAGPYAVQCCALEGPVPAPDCGDDGQERKPRPFRVDALPRLAWADDVAAAGGGDASGGAAATGAVSDSIPPAAGPGAPTAGGRLRLLVGVAGDEATPLGLALGPGDVLLALGGPGTGKTSFLDALPVMNPRVAFSDPGRDGRARSWERLLEDAGAVAAGEARPVVLVDDADGLSSDEEQLVARLVDAGCAVVATAGYSANLYSRCPLALTARSSGVGLMLAPRTPGDGDVFGVRVDVQGRVPPGRAVAVIDGRTLDVQLGHRTPAGAPAGASTSVRPGGFSRGAPQAPAA